MIFLTLFSLVFWFAYDGYKSHKNEQNRENIDGSWHFYPLYKTKLSFAILFIFLGCSFAIVDNGRVRGFLFTSSVEYKDKTNIAILMMDTVEKVS